MERVSPFKTKSDDVVHKSRGKIHIDPSYKYCVYGSLIYLLLSKNY